jgi:hypothetical protein
MAVEARSAGHQYGQPRDRPGQTDWPITLPGVYFGLIAPGNPLPNGRYLLHDGMLPVLSEAALPSDFAPTAPRGEPRGAVLCPQPSPSSAAPWSSSAGMGEN